MRLTVLIFTIMISLVAFADAELYCKANNGSLIPMSDQSDFYDYCTEKMYVKGAVCFTGSREGILALLHDLNEWDMYGGEAYFVAINYKGKEEVFYKVWDGPSDVLLSNMTVKRCN